MKIHRTYLSMIKQQEYIDKGYGIFYNIHISKSAGTTICDTMSESAKKRVFRQNCNIPRMGTPIKTPIYTSRTCNKIDEIVNRDDLKLRFIAQESPMSGHEYHYSNIMPKISIYITI